MTEKHEWRKEEKSLYLPKQRPTLITVPKQQFLQISGTGNPNTNPAFAQHIETLYALSYAIRMMPKSGFVPPGYEEYTVYPLEGVWSLRDPSIGISDKDNFTYTLMIRQPAFVTAELFSRAVDVVKQKKPECLVQEVTLSEEEEGLSVQMMHIGSFDDEPASFMKMAAFLEEEGLTRRLMTHREIYLSDVRRVSPEKQKTVLRWTVQQ